MPKLVIQSGHYGRTSGATGGPGEAALMIRIAHATKALVDAVEGWTADIIPADADDSGGGYSRYRGDAFIALHGDASGSSAATGISVGYRTPEGDRLAQDWKAAYRDRVGGNVGPDRNDNYTGGLAGYYGHRRAVSVGNAHAVVVEHGFMTNPSERAYLESEKGVTAAAEAACIAVTGRLPSTATPEPVPIPTPVPSPEGDAMFVHYRDDNETVGYWKAFLVDMGLLAKGEERSNLYDNTLRRAVRSLMGGSDEFGDDIDGRVAKRIHSAWIRREIAKATS